MIRDGRFWHGGQSFGLQRSRRESSSTCGRNVTSGPDMLTVKRERQQTRNDFDQHAWRPGAFLRIECESNDGRLTHRRFHRPKVKARGTDTSVCPSENPA